MYMTKKQMIFRVEFYSKIYVEDTVTERKVEVPHNYSLEIENLSRCVLNNETPHVSAEFSLKNIKLMDSILTKIGFWN